MQEFAIKQNITAIEFTSRIKCEMSDHVVGLKRILIECLGIANRKTAKLCFVIKVLDLVTRLINQQGGVIHRLIVTDGLDAHIEIMGADRLKTAKLIASRKNQVTIVLIGHMVHSHHQRSLDHYLIVISGILCYHTGQLAIGVPDLIGFIADIERNLLETVIIFHIGARGHLRIDTHLALADRETGLEQDFIRVILFIDREQIVAANKQFHIRIGQDKLIIVIMDKRCLALLIVIDIGIVKTAHIFALDQLRRLPIGIAMSDTVPEVMHVIIKIIKFNEQLVITAHHIHRRDVHIARQAHFEGTNIVIKDMWTSIHTPTLCHCAHSHESTTHHRYDITVIHCSIYLFGWT